MDPLTIKQFDPVLVEAIDCEQKKAGDTTLNLDMMGEKFLQLESMENLNHLISKVIILCPYNAMKKKLSSLKNWQT